jgi:hypothetical protein
MEVFFAKVLEYLALLLFCITINKGTEVFFFNDKAIDWE